MGCNGSVWNPCSPELVVLLTLPGYHVVSQQSRDHDTRDQIVLQLTRPGQTFNSVISNNASISGLAGLI